MTKQRFEQFKELYKEFEEACEKLALKVDGLRGGINYDLTHCDNWVLSGDGNPMCIGHDADTGWMCDEVKAEWLWESDEQIKADIEELMR